ncbi:DUF5696 domain-containing protein [Anaeromassilibacillus sp. SJQ-5]
MRKSKRWIPGLIVLAVIALTVTLCVDFSPRVTAFSAEKTGGVVSKVLFPAEETYTPSPSPAGMELMAQKGFLALHADKTTAAIALEDMRDHMMWFSTPTRVEEDTTAKGNAKNEMYSVLTVTDIVSETNTQKTRNSMIGSVKKNGLTLEKLPDGFRATFEFPEYSYTIPMDFILVGDSLKVSVDTSKIIEKGEQRLFSLRILPYFGAQDWETDGYFILPDGSGSLLRFNNGKGRFTYRSDLYGLDGVVKQDSRTTNQQAAALPCFGIQTKKQGLLAVVEDGAGRAGIHASTSGGESQFNRAYADFSVRLSQMLTVGSGWNSRDVIMYDERPIDAGVISVRYFPADEDQQEIAGLAGIMREYLIRQNGLKPVAGEVPPVYIQTLGAIRKRASILGIRMDSTEVVTSFEKAAQMDAVLKSGGIDATVWYYDGWSEDALRGKVTSQMNVVGKIGGEKGLSALAESLQKTNSRVFLKGETVNFHDNGAGVFSFMDAAKDISKSAIKTHVYKRNTFFPDSRSGTGFLLNNQLANGAFVRLADQGKKYQIGLSAGSLGAQSYTDFSKYGSSRADAVELTRRGLKKAQEALPLLGDNPMGYAIPALSGAVNLPDSGSGFDVCDESVPFLQIVLHGVIPYAGKAINLSGTYTDSFLWSIQSGSLLHYYLLGVDPAELKDTDRTDLYGAGFGLWKDKIIEQYTALKDFYTQTADAVIGGYDTLQPGVVRTRYSNGWSTYVNRTDKDVLIADIAIPKKGYRILQEKGDE